jgi:hypothetical protein
MGTNTAVLETPPRLELVVNNDRPELDLDDSVVHPQTKPDWFGPNGIDWLSPLAAHPGTQFKAKDLLAGRRWQVMEFAVLGKFKRDVLICPAVLIQDIKTWSWVDPLAFCNEWEFRGVTEVPGGDEETTEE